MKVKFWLFILTLSARAGYGLKDIIIYLAGSEIRTVMIMFNLTILEEFGN